MAINAVASFVATGEVHVKVSVLQVDPTDINLLQWIITILLVLSCPVICDTKPEMISSNTLLNLEATIFTKSKSLELTAMSKVLIINAHNLSNHGLVPIPK